MKIVLFLMLMLSPAFGQEPIDVPDGWIMPRIPDAAEKNAALMMAYELNGQSMVRIGAIDLTAPKSIKTIPITPDQLPPETKKTGKKATQ